MRGVFYFLEPQTKKFWGSYSLIDYVEFPNLVLIPNAILTIVDIFHFRCSRIMYSKPNDFYVHSPTLNISQFLYKYAAITFKFFRCIIAFNRTALTILHIIKATTHIRQSSKE